MKTEFREEVDGWMNLGYRGFLFPKASARLGVVKRGKTKNDIFVGGEQKAESI